MKRLALIVAMLGAAVAVSPFIASVSAAAGSGAPGGTVGVIDIERTLYETPAGKRASETFEKGRIAKQADLDKQQKELQQYAAELDKQASVLKPEVAKQKKDDLEKKFVALQQYYVKAERDLAGARASLIQDLLKQATPKIEIVAKNAGVTMIVDQSSVLWSEKSVDLTDQLNALMK
jgi:Skp family chaperone for outer membrane proteins